MDLPDLNEEEEESCPPYLVYGKKKEMQPLEEFWMQRLETIEAQYEQHVAKLGKSLLDNRANIRTLKSKDDEIDKLKNVLEETTEKLEKVSSLKGQLQNDLSSKHYKETQLKDKLSKVEDYKEKVLESLALERLERRKCERELTSLRHHLTNLEKDKKFLSSDLVNKETEKNRIHEQNEKLSQKKYDLIKNLTEIDQEKRLREAVNMKMVEDIGRLLEGSKSQEYLLLKQRKEIDLMIEKMKVKKQDQQEALRKLHVNEKSLVDANEFKKLSREAMEHLERQISHWKQEFEFKEGEHKSSVLEIKTLRNENSQLRCQVAELREKLNQNEKQLKAVDSEKRRVDVELKKAKGQARSVYLEMCRNELMKRKLANKILKSHPEIQETLDARRAAGKPFRKGGRREEGPREIESYRKQIFQLEKQKKELEVQVNEFQRKQNRLQFQMKKYDGMEKQILWTEKSMIKLEGDRVRLEELVKSMTLNTPGNKKVPLEKLVTDPSVIDRMANYRLLQKRLMQQTENVENLKRNAIRIIEYRKLKEEDRSTDLRIAPKLRLSRWKEGSSEDTLADVDQQLLDQEGQGPAPPPFHESSNETKYYNEYMAYLDTEIPKVKKQIEAMEVKQDLLLGKMVKEKEREPELEIEELEGATLGDAEKLLELQRDADEDIRVMMDSPENDVDEYEEERDEGLLHDAEGQEEEERENEDNQDVDNVDARSAD